MSSTAATLVTRDFAPGLTPQSVSLHRACFEIWQYECQSQPLS